MLNDALLVEVIVNLVAHLFMFYLVLSSLNPYPRPLPRLVTRSGGRLVVW